MNIRLTVNGQEHTLGIQARQTLAEVLRDELHLTGTHLACEQGVCGACTVTVDETPVRSCLMLGVQADGSNVGTVEGLGSFGGLSPVQQGFLDATSFQCGFCTPGIVVTVSKWIEQRLARDDGPPTDEEIREMLAAHLCRCTGYSAIVAGVVRAWVYTTDQERPCNG